MKKIVFYFIMLGMLPLFWGGKSYERINNSSQNDSNLIANSNFESTYAENGFDSAGIKYVDSVKPYPSDSGWHLNHQPGHPIFMQDVPPGG